MKKYKVSLFLFSLVILCILAFNMIGSEVAADGTLIEPFFLIPTAYLFAFLGLASFIFQWFHSRRAY